LLAQEKPYNTCTTCSNLPSALAETRIEIEIWHQKEI
jgi:hypothetical protein